MLKGICSILIILFVADLSYKKPANETIGTEPAIKAYKENAKFFYAKTQLLYQAISSYSEKDSHSLKECVKALKDCRIAYKPIEYFVEYFMSNRVKIFNIPPVFEVEEPYMEFQAPVGLQLLESLILENRDSNKKQMLTNAEIIKVTAESLPFYLPEKPLTDQRLLQSLQLELIRIATLGISGYDAPLLKTGIEESQIALATLLQTLVPYLANAPAAFQDSLHHYFEKSIDYLKKNPAFDEFDRLHFLTQCLLPAQRKMYALIQKLQLQCTDNNPVSFETSGLFDPAFLNRRVFAGNDYPENPTLVSLGEKLFFDTRLSGDGSRSCASCHQPSKYFTDGLPRSLTLDGHNTVLRNAPSLLYTVYQHGFFWDARAPTLEAQVLTVLGNPAEMGTDFENARSWLSKNRHYRRLFRKAFPNHNIALLFSRENIAIALSAYQQSLPVMTSPFDAYIAGDTTRMNHQQIAGFNLFMGKALCGTCHFPPLFNGLLPPLYEITELESVGMVANGDLEHPVADKDSGRFHFFPIEFYTGVFKTPTVRNTAGTAPYMHNGALPDLKTVIEFYDKGGGAGLGLNMPYQTLSKSPLQLSETEIDQLVAFIESLTDAPVIKNTHKNP